MDEVEVMLNLFFEVFSSRILHEESSSDSDKEHFFIAINKEKYINKNNVVKNFILVHKNNYPLTDISETSKRYIESDLSYEYIWLDCISKSDLLFMKKFDYLKNNTNNHISVMWLGRPYDSKSHFSNTTEVNIEKFKNAAEKMKKNLKKEIKLKTPIIKKRIEKILRLKK